MCPRGRACTGRSFRGQKNCASGSRPRPARSCWPSTMTLRADEAAVGCKVSKSSGTSARRAGKMPPLAPPAKVGVQAVAGRHAAAVLVDQLAQGDARRRELDAGLAHAPADAEPAAARCAHDAPARNQARALLRRCRAPSTASQGCAPAWAAPTGRAGRCRAGAAWARRACPRCFRMADSSPQM